MKFLTTPFVVEALIVSCSWAAVAPKLDFPVLASRYDSSSQPQQNSYVLGNLSYLFGYQMSGASASEAATEAACSSLVSIGHGKWAEMGLNPNYIRSPICDSSSSSPDPVHSISPIIQYTSNIFLTQLLGSIDDDALSYMCMHVNFYLLDRFLLDDAVILGGICDKVGMQLPPRPFTPAWAGSDGAHAAKAAKKSASTLYALMLASGATSTSELKALCADAGTYVDNLDSELMNGKAFQDTLCTIKETISVDQGVGKIFSWTTRIFLTMIENISDKDGWVAWLCQHVDVDRMNGVNLNGKAAKQHICEQGS